MHLFIFSHFCAHLLLLHFIVYTCIFAEEATTIPCENKINKQSVLLFSYDDRNRCNGECNDDGDDDDENMREINGERAR